MTTRNEYLQGLPDGQALGYALGDLYDWNGVGLVPKHNGEGVRLCR